MSDSTLRWSIVLMTAILVAFLIGVRVGLVTHDGNRGVAGKDQVSLPFMGREDEHEKRMRTLEKMLENIITKPSTGDPGRMEPIRDVPVFEFKVVNCPSYQPTYYTSDPPRMSAEQSLYRHDAFGHPFQPNGTDGYPIDLPGGE